ncbi:homeobox protein NANOG-like [Ambystoma mexicanum]|uniref:homeobox protein NANOG-like n=1 Tax=Ambystoma mexicanum TaxID=8296 RepID=UPI0037E87646
MPAHCMTPQMRVPGYQAYTELNQPCAVAANYAPAFQGNLQAAEEGRPVPAVLPSSPDSATSPKVDPFAQCAPDVAAGGETKAQARKRTCFSQEQLVALHRMFQKQHYMNPMQAQQLAADLNLTYKQVKNWFQNRRMKHKLSLKDSVWLDKRCWQPQASSILTPAQPQSTGCPESSSHLPQRYTVHHSALAQRVTSHPYQKYSGIQNPHQKVLSEDAATVQHREAAPQCMGPQQYMNRHQNYPTIEYAGARPVEGYNLKTPLQYPSMAPYPNYYYQQPPPYIHQQGRPDIRFQSTQGM